MKTPVLCLITGLVIGAGVSRSRAVRAESQDALSLQFSVPKVAVWAEDEADIICIERHDSTQSCYKTLALLGGMK